jgi:hypothetical protein
MIHPMETSEKRSKPPARKREAESGVSLLAVLALLAVVGLAAVSVSNNFSAKLKMAKVSDSQTVLQEIRNYISLKNNCGLMNPREDFFTGHVVCDYYEDGSENFCWNDIGVRSACDGGTPANPKPLTMFDNEGDVLIANGGTTKIAGYQLRAQCWIYDHTYYVTNYSIDFKRPGSQVWESLFKDQTFTCQ